MLTKSGRPTRAARRAEALRRLRLVVEARLAAGESYTELTVERLASDAGISRSTFYFHFADKGDLLRGMTEDLREEFLSATRAWSDAPADVAREDLEARIAGVVSAYRDHQGLLAAVVDAAAYDAHVRDEFLEMVAEIEDGLAEHLADRRALGLLGADLDPEATAGWLIWMFERGLHQMVQGAGDADAARLTRSLAALVWRAVYAPDALTAR